jgi:hypothetical protein
LHICSCGGKYKYICLPPLPKAKADRDAAAEGPFSGIDYDMLLHFTIAHLRRVDGALPPSYDGEKAFDFFKGKGTHRYIFCIFTIWCIFYILTILHLQAYNS